MRSRLYTFCFTALILLFLTGKLAAQNYTFTTSVGNSIVPGTTLVPGSQADDAVITVALPFPYTVYGTVYNSANVSTNGNLQFTTTNNIWTNTCPLPTTTNLGTVFMPHWDDMLLTAGGKGIYTSTSGVAPNRIFNIEWRADYFSGGGTANFEVRLFEGQQRVDFIYDVVSQSGSSASIGVQREVAPTTFFTQFSCNTASLSTGLGVSLQILAPCPAVITSQPVNRTICAGANTTFDVTVFGAPPVTYQWQINQGSGFIDLINVSPFSGVTTSSLVITGAGTVYNGNQFRVIINNGCGPVTSNTVTLTVNPVPTVNVGPSGQCAPVTLVASGNANTYSWSPATGLNTTTGSTVIASPTFTTVYTVTGTITATGCQNSATVTVLGTPATPVITPPAPIICAGTIQPLSVPGSQASFNGGGVSIPSSGISTPYPSVINVSGLPTSGVSVQSVTINGVVHTFPADIDILLQSPTGTNVVIMSDVGGSADNTGQNYTFQDGAPLMSFTTLNPSGTYRCSNSGTPDTWVAPGPGSITQANPVLSSFSGNPNGNWNLFVVDDLGGDLGSIASWSITFSIPVARWSPAAGLFTDPAATIPYVLGTAASTVYFLQSPSVTTQYTYTVISSLGACTSQPSTVTVTVNPVPTLTVSSSSTCGPATLTATGNYNTVTWSPTTGLFTDPARTTAYTGTNLSTVYAANPSLDITYTATATLTGTGCTTVSTVTVFTTPAAPVVAPASGTICLGAVMQLSVTPVAVTTQGGGAIQIVDASTGNPYPSTIPVSGLPTTGARVKSVNISGFTHTFPSDVDILLQSPTGVDVIIMSDAGGGTGVTNVNIVLDDAAAAGIPTPILSGTYRPTNVGTPDNFPAPGPGNSSAGSALSVFTGNLNGTWRLYVVDDAGADLGTIANWTITFEITGALWSPAASLFTNAGATIPYVAGTIAQTVWAKPTTTTTYSITRATANCTSAATQVIITVLQPIAITTQPANQTVCQGANATFSVATSGNFQSYQWQVSTGGGPFTNIPATGVGGNPTAVTASLVLTNVSTALSGNQYRVIVTNSCNTVTSNAATLTVNAAPVVTATDLFNLKVCISDTLIPLVGTPSGGTWSGIGVVGSNFVPGLTSVGNYVLTYTFTNSFGCTVSDTTRVFVVDCPERARLLINDAAILYPNPNTGRFNIRMNSTLYNYLGMRVYTEGGSLVRIMKFTSLRYGSVVPVDLTNLPGGVYLVKLYYDDGVRTSEKTFKVIMTRN